MTLSDLKTDMAAFKSSELFLVVMAGGSGTRFWPKSTPAKPKQLLSFGKDETLLQQTLNRFESLVDSKHTYILTTRSLENAVLESVTERVQILAEPQGRNTAPCLFWAAKTLEKLNPEAIMMVMPSDHFISGEPDFLNVLKQAIDRASANDELVTLGIKPTRPETGYGYLKLGSALAGGGVKVASFVEKPNLEKAKEYVGSGKYLWNGGMFLWKVKTLLNAFRDHMPEMEKIWKESEERIESAYPKFTATSIDYGIMEKSEHVVTFELDCGWDDLGNWTSLESLPKEIVKHQEGNFLSAGELISIESSGNVIDAPGKTVALLGVEDLIVVHSGDSILVARKDRAQDIRKITEKIKG